jgi:hypothetical protein
LLSKKRQEAANDRRPRGGRAIHDKCWHEIRVALAPPRRTRTPARTRRRQNAVSERNRPCRFHDRAECRRLDPGRHRLGRGAVPRGGAEVGPRRQRVRGHHFRRGRCGHRGPSPRVGRKPARPTSPGHLHHPPPQIAKFATTISDPSMAPAARTAITMLSADDHPRGRADARRRKDTRDA